MGHTHLFHEPVGCEGYRTVGQLADSHLDEVPKHPGIYFVVRQQLEPDPPPFLQTSGAGWFKGKDPTVSVAKLAANWVPGARVLYVGRAGGGSSNATLRSRLRQKVRFALGHAVGGWGGRIVWQLEDWRALQFCWIRDKNAIAAETLALQQFVAIHGRLPFANLKT